MESQLVDLKYDENSNKITINQKRGFRNPKEKSDFTKVQKTVKKINLFDNKTTPEEVVFQKDISEGALGNVSVTEDDLLNQEDIDDNIELLPDEEAKKRAVENVLLNLKRRFGLDFKIINDPKLRIKGAYSRKTGKIVINLAYVTNEYPPYQVHIALPLAVS